MKRLQPEWETYKELLKQRGCPDSDLEELRHAFYGGAIAVHSIIMRMLDPGTEPTLADLRKMDELVAEMQEFVHELERKGAN